MIRPMQICQKSFQYGRHKVLLESGRIARQADASVWVNMNDTVVLVTVSAKKQASENQDFFPLAVHYQEKTYAAGKIPGGFFKREARPSEKEVLSSRLIDRSLRPLFPKGFFNEVQVIATVLSLNPEVNPDIAAMIGAFAALELSGIPFDGPGAGARVGFIDNQYVLNPDTSELEQSGLDLIVAGTADAVLMVESEAKLLNEDQMLGGVAFGHEQMQSAIEAIKALAQEVGKPGWTWTAPEENKALYDKLAQNYTAGIEQAYSMTDKIERQTRLEELRQQAFESVDDEQEETVNEIKSLFKKIEKYVVRSRILAGEPRIDGRDTRHVRPLDIHTGVLPRAHGSALFTRGETQALVVATLGGDRDSQIIDALEGEWRDRFMLHYNFPPYSVGEVGFIGSPKRREIGHGNLAKRAIKAVVPDEQTFPYVIRVVSEITESNGSSSMATVCGASLALMNAGVPLKMPIAGIAMGLVLEGDKYAVLTDILGDEDHLGDMDFKVAGSHEGISALQMDIKVKGVTPELMAVALDQARSARLHILEKMNAVISEPNNEMSPYAPRLLTMQINRDRIRDVIGKGGATIRTLTEETGTTIDISDDGLVKISSVNKEAAELACKRIEELTCDAEEGKVYRGKVAKITDFGAFVTILPGKDGLVHISEISSSRDKRIERVSDELSEGDVVSVKVLEIDKRGRIRLSMRGVTVENT